MKAKRNSVINDDHVNQVLGIIAERLLASKIIVDDDGQPLSDEELKDVTDAFKASLGLSNLSH